MSNIVSVGMVKERMDVLMFFCERVTAEEGKRLLSRDAFAAYQEWRKENGFNNTVLSIDGFGRFIPKTFTTKHMRYYGDFARGIVDARLK